jgi:hypothetical protein
MPRSASRMFGSRLSPRARRRRCARIAYTGRNGRRARRRGVVADRRPTARIRHCHGNAQRWDGGYSGALVQTSLQNGLALQRKGLDLQRNHLAKTNAMLMLLRPRQPPRRASVQPSDGPPPVEAICPYKGLQAFRPEDAVFLFGREALVGEPSAPCAPTSTVAWSKMCPPRCSRKNHAARGRRSRSSATAHESASLPADSGVTTKAATSASTH